MKILQLTNKVPYPPSDGGVIAVLSLAEGLAKAGHDITILSMRTNKHSFYTQNIPEEFSSKIHFDSVKVPADIKLLGLIINYLFSKTPYTASRFISKEYKKRLVFLLKSNKYDIIQLEGLYLSPYIKIIKKQTKAPIVMRSHNIEHEIWERIRENTNNQLKKIYLKNLNRKLKKFETQFLSEYDLVLPITKRDGKQLKKLGYQGLLHPLPTGIDTARYRCDKEKIEYPTLFHLGSLDWKPNLEGIKWFLQEVWSKVLEKQSNLKFHIAGRNASKAFQKELNQYPNVIFDGEVEDANSYINSKAIMIVPLLSGSGMRIKIIEGMALSKAIVSTNIGMEGINITNRQDAIVEDTPQELADGIIKLIQDKERFNKMCFNARQFIEQNFDNTVIIDQLCKAYENVIQVKLNDDNK